MINIDDVKLDLDKITKGNIESTPGSSLKWVGTGILDKFLEVIDKNLEIQFKSNRLTGSDYAKVYIQLFTSALEKSIALLQADITTQLQALQTKAEIEQSKAQTKLYHRQIQGFDDNIYLKLLKTQLDVFGALFASGNLEFSEVRNLLPSVLTSSEVSTLYNKIINLLDEYKRQDTITE